MKTVLIVITSLVILHSTATQKLEWMNEDSKFWMDRGKNDLLDALKRSNMGGKARNVVIFLGDGMGMSTITATRIFKGQLQGRSGEETYLSFEKFPSVGLVKTYNINKQVPDSAGTATAIFTGVKSKFYMVGFDVNAQYNKCHKETNKRSALTSIMQWAQDAGKSTGFVTTTRITHATPAALYAHVNHRDWECDGGIPLEYRQCTKDIARQLLEDDPGKGFKVIMGGGWNPLGATNFEDEDESCQRNDGRNIVQEWIKKKGEEKVNYKYVNDTRSLMNLKIDELEYLLGVFSPGHMTYNSLRDRSPLGQPSLVEMTTQAIKMLQKNEKGYVLMVEGGRIDHGHHENFARLALEEGAQFDDAIISAMTLIDPSETLVIVTADHSHAFTINGYPVRGNDILGLGNDSKVDYAYETLTYANGPSFFYHRLNDSNEPNKTWRDVSTDVSRGDAHYQHFSPLYMEDETHAGEDVPVYATGPQSHLLQGVHEQNYIAHVISYAACIGPHRLLCHNTLHSSAAKSSLWTLLPLLTTNFLFLVRI